jgi:hypothetical protein
MSNFSGIVVHLVFCFCSLQVGCTAWMRILLTFYLRVWTEHHDRVFPLLMEIQQKLRMQMYVEWFAQKFWQIIVWLSTPHLADHHSYSWWRWWSDTLWATLIRLWPHSLSCYPQTVVKSFLCNLIDMLSVFLWEKWMWQANFISAYCVQIQMTWLCKSLLLPSWLVECSCIMWLLDINANSVFSCSHQLLMGLVDDRVPISVWADGMGSL